jgi:hypothetical protein
MLRFVQHDSRVVVPNTLFCHSERQRGIHSWMLHFVQHDKTEDVIPSVSEESSTWMLRFAQHDKTEDVIPSACEESIAWMLHFVQHDKGGVVPHALFCHSERQRGIQYGCFASFSMTNQASVVHCAQHDKTEDVIPSVSEESSMDASLRSA